MKTVWFAALIGASALTSTAAIAQPSPRAQVQHLLRRFAFSVAPETVTAVQASGIAAWLAQQEQPSLIDDSGTELETLPTQLVNGGLPDYNIFERAVVQHMILTRRQVQAKLELHWLDHFSVGLGKVGDAAVMYEYDQVIRNNALGNFATLLTTVAKESAMLEWLDNNWNVGPVANENFGRESMQLYTMGTTQLNMDGSVKMNAKGLPAPNYSQQDVRQVALAMTGYGVVYDGNNNNPQTRFSVQYYPSLHYSGPLKFFGQTQAVPTDGTAIGYVMNIMAHRPSVAPFQARELLQRFVTENPSPQYVSDIAAVWKKTADAPDQIAQVITAIVNHPEFIPSYHAMLKSPVEMAFGSLRQMPGVMQLAANSTPGNSLIWELSNLGQQLFWPESVFSFYRPGDLAVTLNTGTVLARTGIFANITSSTPDGAYTDTYIDMVALRSRIGDTSERAIRNYLLDSLVDGGTPALSGQLSHYLGPVPSDARVRGAIWLLLNAPDYAVN